MRNTLFILLMFISDLLYSYDFEVEILSNEGDINIVEFADILTYRQFRIKSNWKDNLGDWGVIDCSGNHTVFKNKGTILKNYCKGSNVLGEDFWIIMDRESDNFDAGIGKIEYIKGTGKFKEYKGTKCVYAVSHLPLGKGSFIKSKCNFNKKNN